MLLAMSRFAVIALLIACGNGSKPAAEQDKNATGGGSGQPEVVAVPGATGAAPGVGAAPAEGASDPAKLTDATKQRAKNPAFNLKPEEGTLTVNKPEGKAGAATTAKIELAPGSGYHVATDYPIKLWLEPPEKVKIDKTFLTAGGRTKAQGDAATLTEQQLAFAVQATPETAGSYEITGVLSFGICEKDSCHPKTQPITIQVAAN